MAEYLMTAESKKEIEEELNALKSTGRAEMVAKIEEARSFGDLSENAEYDIARDEQAKMEQRIVELEVKLENAVIIDSKVKTDMVRVGTTVTIREVASGKESKYQIVGSQDSDPFNGKISNESPVGKALIGNKKGEVVTVDSKNGRKEYKIEKIS